MNPPRDLFLFWLSCVTTLALTPLAIHLANRFKFLDLPGPHKIHARPVPYGGGLAVAGGVLFPILVSTILEKSVFGTPGSPTLRVYALGSLVILLLGLVDDRRRLSAGFRLAVETIVALGVAIGGERLELFTGDRILGTVVTVLWIVGITNAFNLLDHMDGLCSGAAAIVSTAFLVVAWQTGQTFIITLLLPIVGACLGFLLFNFPPAKIFLGDAGSLFIGFWLSCLTISFTFYKSGTYPLYTYAVPLAVLAVPLFDAATVILIRLWNRRPIFEGDTNHLAHRLTGLGMSPRLAVLTVYVLTLYAGLSAVLLYHVEQTGALIVLSQLLLTFGIITFLQWASRKHEQAR